MVVCPAEMLWRPEGGPGVIMVQPKGWGHQQAHVILPLRRLRQWGHELEAGLGNVMRLCLAENPKSCHVPVVPARKLRQGSHDIVRLLSLKRKKKDRDTVLKV